MPNIQSTPKSRFKRFRITVPTDLRDHFGQREIIRSLGTDDPVEARRVASNLTADYKAKFADARARILAGKVDSAPRLVDDFLKILADRKDGNVDLAVYTVSKGIVFRICTAWGREAYTAFELRNVFAGVPQSEFWDSTDDDDLSRLIPEEDRPALVKRLKVLQRHSMGAGFPAVIEVIRNSGRWEVVSLEVQAVAEFTGTTIPLGSPMAHAVAAALFERLLAHQAVNWDNALIELVYSATSPAPLSSPQSPKAVTASTSQSNAGPNIGARFDANQTLSKALERWKVQMGPKESAVTETTRSVRRFISLFGDMPIANITPNLIFDYRDFLENMPRGINLAKLEAERVELRQAVAAAHEAERKEAEADDEFKPQRLSPTSIKKDIGGLSAIFAACIGERWILTNPAEAIPVSGYSKRRKVYPFRPRMMVRLFESPMFTGCAGIKPAKRTQRGPLVFQDALYWSFLFGTTVGPRQAEIATADIDSVEEAVGPDGKRIVGIFLLDGKNEHSDRVVIVHPMLVALGFKGYVDDRRKAGKKTLFDLPSGSTKKLSEKLNDYIDAVVVDDRRFVFHSLRHEFADRSEMSIDVETSKKIMGHARGRLYGLGAPLHHAARELEKIEFDYIDWPRLLRAAGRSLPTG